MIVFFLTCACVDIYGSALKHILQKKNHIELLHGKMVQKRREKVMERFRLPPDELEGCALFCTDVAARGLDVTDVQWVVQFDAPQDPAFYVHRVGRCARAGRTGASLLFLTRKEEAYIELLQMRKVPLSPLPDTEQCCPPQLEEEDDAETKDDETKAEPKEEAKAETKDGVILNAAGDELDDALVQVRAIVLKDRDMLEKGTKAFTSYIRAYKEHHCAFIFR
jgi:ATP-dependent RNA helicase DDX55/SPB4